MDKLNILNDVIDKTLKKGASAADAIIINSTSLSSEVRLGKVIGLERSENSSIGLRVLIGQKQAIVSTANLNEASLNSIIDQAIDMAKVIPENPHLFLAAEEQLAKNIPDLNLYDANEPTAENLIEKAKLCEDTALENQHITNSEGAGAAYQANEIYFAASNGFCQNYKSSSSSLSLSVIAGKNEHMQTGYAYSVSRFVSDLKSPQEIGVEAAKFAIDKMNPRKIATAELPVIFERKMAKGLLASLASAINGFSISRGASFLIDSLGKEIFKSNINIIDDPFIIKGLASRPFDAEAIAGNKLNIIENGRLNSYFLDLQTASQLNLKTTGHATRGLTSSPTPSCSNLYMEAGKESLTDLIKSIKKGILVTEIFGHGANIVTGDYSQGIGGFYIENGEIVFPISEMTVAGHLKEMFKMIIPASDLKFENSINSPSLLIEKMTVAGV